MPLGAFWRSLFSSSSTKKARRTLTIAVLGDGGVGKTCLSVQFCQGHFIVQYDPTVSDRYTKLVMLNEEEVMLEVLDTAGQEEYVALQDAWIRQADGFLIVYAVDNPLSFSIAQRLHSEVTRSFMAESDAKRHRKPIFLVGNKKDLMSRSITTEDLRQCARNLQCKAIETSAKLNAGVDKAFTAVAQEVIRQQDELEERRRSRRKKSWF